MLLKRIYDHSSGKPKLTYVRVLRAGKIQKFTTRFVEQQTAAGIVSLVEGKIILKTAPEEQDLKYKIVRGPGLYCCHCDAFAGDPAEARQHIALSHAGAESPDADNPVGYRRDLFYVCEKEN